MVQTDKYDSINTADTSKIATMWLNSCQNPTHYKKKNVHGQISTAGEIFFESQ